jgi:hypothetical protein
MRTLFLFFLFISASQASGGQVVVNDVEWEPYFFASKKDSPPGFAKEMLIYCLDRTIVSKNYKFFVSPIKRTHNMAERGNLDIVVYSKNEKREKFLHYNTEPLFNVSYRPFVKTESKDITISKVSDLDKYTIGHIDGISLNKELREYLKSRDKSLPSVDTSEKQLFNIRKIIKGRFQVGIENYHSAMWVAHKMKLSDQIKALPFEFFRKNYYLTVSKKSKNISEPKKFLKSFDSCLIELKKTSTFTKMLSRYGFSSQ